MQPAIKPKLRLIQRNRALCEWNYLSPFASALSSNFTYNLQQDQWIEANKNMHTRWYHFVCLSGSILTK